MIENKEEIQIELSQLIHQDIVKIVIDYSQKSLLNLELLSTLIQDINLLKTYNVNYTHNEELGEIIVIMKNELKDLFTSRAVALLCCFEYLLNTNSNFKQILYINLTLRVPSEIFLESFSFFNIIVPNIKELFQDFITYIFNDKFLALDENIQIDCIYKIWSFSQKIYHDNDASKFAYEKLKLLFDKALLFDKTEVAFWLYYTPLHYFHSGTGNNIDELNEKFKNEIEKPLEKYILQKIIPKYKIEPNKKVINKDGKIKVAFVMQRIIRHSTTNVFYSLVKNLMDLKSDEYEFILYDMAFTEAGGSQEDFVKEFTNLGIKYINLHEEIFGNKEPIYSLLEKSIKTREILINDDIDVLIGLHTRLEYIFLYATRTALKQIYWYHASNAQYDIEGIDERITHAKAPKNEYNFSMFLLPNEKSKTLPKIEQKEIDNVRAQYPTESFILGYIGRLIKIENEEYLETIAQIMKQNPKTIFLACGSGDQSKIQQIVNKLGIEKRFYFTGHVNPHLYGYVIDYFLSSFVGGGESLAEFALKGKPYLSMINKNSISKKELEMYEESMSAYGFTRVFALTKKDYVNVANNIIQDTLCRQNIINFVVKEHVNQDFGTVTYFMREIHYYAGKGFVELLNKFIKTHIEKFIDEKFPKLSFYKEKIYKKIENKHEIKLDDFIEELSLGDIEQRAYFNYILAEHFFYLKKYSEASISINRAWLMFGFKEYVLELFVNIHMSLKNYEAIYQAYKRIGMESEKINNISKALYYFNKAHYNQAYLKHEDSFDYDFDILDSIERMAKPYKKNKKKGSNKNQNIIKVAFLIYGFSHKNSSLLRGNLPWLRSIDINNKNVHIFVMDKKHTFNDDSIKNASIILNMGHKIHIFPDDESDTKRLINIIDTIRDFDPDILVTGAAMAKYEHAFIVATQPASKITGFLYGPPEQFCYPFMDEIITFSYHPAMDAPSQNIKFVEATYTPCKIVKNDKFKFLNIPSNTVVISSIGRHTKFQSAVFLNKIQEILLKYDNVYYIMIGILKKDIKYKFDEKFKNRIIYTGWVNNTYDYLSISDIVIDTYPSGGGLTILDAFNYRIPTIMFKNNFCKKFSQKDWSLDLEYMNLKELIIEDINSNDFEILAGKLIKSTELRKIYGEKLYSHLKHKFIKQNIDFVDYKEL